MIRKIFYANLVFVSWLFCSVAPAMNPNSNASEDISKLCDSLFESFSKKWLEGVPVQFSMSFMGPPSQEKHPSLLCTTILECEGSTLSRTMFFTNCNRKITLTLGSSLTPRKTIKVESYEQHKEICKRIWGWILGNCIVPKLTQIEILPQGNEEQRHSMIVRTMKSLEEVIQSKWVDHLLVEASRGIEFTVRGTLIKNTFEGRIFYQKASHECNINLPPLSLGACTGISWLFEIASDPFITNSMPTLQKALVKTGLLRATK
jgi:hypothetical protein